jgi:hypothetical protein
MIHSTRYDFLKFAWLGGLIFFIFSVQAQIEQVARYEREHKNTDPEFIVISMGDKGLALVRNTDEYKDGKQLWEVITVDHDLKERWSLQMDIESRLRLVGYEFHKDWIYILFRTNEHEASDLTMFTIHRTTQEIKRYSIKQEVSFKITHLGILENVIVLGGYVNDQPAILLHDLATENLKIVPGFFVSNTELLDLRTNVNNTFNTLVLDQKSKEQKRLILKTFDATGAMLLEHTIELDQNRSILSGMTSTLLNDDLFITGTWTVGNTSKSATGIYSVVVDPFNKQSLNYYDYGQLTHFLEYQTPKKAARLKQRSLEAKVAGFIPEFKAYSSIMRLDERPEGYALLTEVYQPNSSINSNHYWNDYYNPYFYSGYSPYGYNPFSTRYYNRPYQYNNATVQSDETKILNAAVILFDRQGELVSDYAMALNDKKSAGVEQTSDFLVNKSKVTMGYKKEKEVFFTRSSEEDEIVTDTLTLSLDNPDEIIRTDTEDSFIRHWYANHMYIWGYQRIKLLREDSDTSHRDVFYINKIRVD